MKKILITGGCGFVGTNIAIKLKNKGYDVYSLDNLSRKGSLYNKNILTKSKIKNYKIDIFDTKKIIKLPKFDLIIDCCAEPSVEVSKDEMDRVINTNLIGTFNVLKKCLKDNSKIIFLSSSRIYPIKEITKFYKNYKFSKNKVNEKFNIIGPKSIYGLTKFASEELIKEFNYAFKIKYIVNRCGVLSGPLQFGKQDQGFVSLWVWKHILKKNLKYIGYGGKGLQTRDVLHIDDLTDLILLQIKNFNKINNEIFCVGGSTKSFTNLKNLTKICENITGNKIKFKKIKKTSIYDIPCFITDNKKVNKFYKWSPKRNIHLVVKDTYEWIVKNKFELKKYFL